VIPGTPPLPAGAYLERLAAIHRVLGIHADYGTDRHLEPFPEANEADLIQVAVNPDGREVKLLPPAARAWQRMLAAAATDDVPLIAISGFRSVARQTEIIAGKLAAGQPLAKILRCVAAPGYSEHHTARAIDIGSPEHIELDEAFAKTSAFRWLESHAHEFGFHLSFPRGNPHGIVYEPWHWCWRP
jgi:zinc D-Ala-D-Ala carboxypeptidase